MLVDGLLVGVGALTILWGSWLLPRQLDEGEKKLASPGQEHFNQFVQQRATRRLLFAMPAVGGGLLIVTGIVLGLT